MRRFLLPELRYLAGLIRKEGGEMRVEVVKKLFDENTLLTGTRQDHKVFDGVIDNVIETMRINGDDMEATVDTATTLLDSLYDEYETRENYWGMATFDRMLESDPELAAAMRDQFGLQRIDGATFEAVKGRKLPDYTKLPENAPRSAIMSDEEYEAIKPFLTVPGLPGSPFKN